MQRRNFIRLAGGGIVAAAGVTAPRRQLDVG